MTRPPHRFIKKICHWYYCVRCGLVALKNQATEDAIRKGCDPDEDEPSPIRCATPDCQDAIAKYGEHYHSVHPLHPGARPHFMPDAVARCARCGGYTNGTDWQHVCRSCGKELAPGELVGLFVPHLCADCEQRAAAEDVARGAVCRACGKPYTRCCC